MLNQCFRVAKLCLHRVEPFKQRIRLPQILFKHFPHHPKHLFLPEQNRILVIRAEHKRTVLSQNEIRKETELIQPCRHVVVIIPRTVITAAGTDRKNFLQTA